MPRQGSPGVCRHGPFPVKSLDLAIAPRIKKGTKIWREVKLSTSFFNLALFQIIEAVPKRFPLTAGFKIKSKIPDFERGKAKILTTGIHLVFRGLKFEPDVPMAGGKRGRFEIASLLLIKTGQIRCQCKVGCITSGLPRLQIMRSHTRLRVTCLTHWLQLTKLKYI